MKPYKPFLSVLITFFLITFLSGCITIPLKKHYDISVEELTSVQFYDLRNQEPENRIAFNETIEPVYTIPQNDTENFLSDFSKLEFSDSITILPATIDPSFYYGDWVIRINFSNGQYAFYSCAGYGETFDTDGKCISSTHFSCNDNELKLLVSKYYEIE